MTGWIFICGINNSGTTLIDHMVGLHPMVDPLRAEGQAMSEVMPTAGPLKKGYVASEAMDVLREPVPDELIPQLTQDWLDARKTVTPGAKYIVEKSPVNIIRTPWLQSKFPGARFVSIVRNPYAFIMSLRSRRIDISPSRAMQHWVKSYTTLLEDAQSLNHFHMVKYEELITDYSPVMRAVDEFLELPLHDYVPDVEAGLSIGYWEGRYPYGQDRGLDNPNPGRIEQFFRHFSDQAIEVNSIGKEMMDYFEYETRQG